MDKKISVDYIMLKERYLTRIICFQIPILLVCIITFFLFYILRGPHAEKTAIEIFRNIAYYTSLCDIVIMLITIIVFYSLLKNHKKYTNVHITDKFITISIYKQSVLSHFKPARYTQLILVKFPELTNIYTEKADIIIKGKIRYYYDTVEDLQYNLKDNKISFDKWWYNDNPKNFYNEIKIFNYFRNISKYFDSILILNYEESQRIAELNKFRNSLLETAASQKTIEAREKAKEKLIARYK